MKSEEPTNKDYYPAGKTIIIDQEGASDTYYIEKGRVEVSRIDNNGKKVILADLGPGNIFGEMAMFTDSKRGATVKTVDGCVAVKVTKRLEDALENSDPLLSEIIRVMSLRLKATNQRVESELSSLEDIESLVYLAVHSTTKSIRQDVREDFQKEIVPALKGLKEVLEKYYEYEKSLPQTPDDKVSNDETAFIQENYKKE